MSSLTHQAALQGLDSSIYQLSSQSPRKALFERSKKAAAVVKPAPNKHPKKDFFKDQEELCIQTSSIGIDYNIPNEIPHDANTVNAIKAFCDSLEDSISPRTPYFVDCFKNKLKIGDDIILGQGKNGALYVVEIAGSLEFESNEAYAYPSSPNKGLFHRRKLKNIQALPSSTKFGPLSISTIKMRPPNGWVISQ